MPIEVGFTRKDQVGYNLIQLWLYLYLSNLQDLFIKYLLNRLGNGPPRLQAKWTDSWWAPCSFSLSPVDVVPIIPKLVTNELVFKLMVNFKNVV
jgi:hypothetical protein